MATLTSAIKKAKKITGMEPIISGQFFYFDYKGYEVSFAQNGNSDSATCFYTKRIGQKDDYQSDYFCGTFHDNLTQAFRFLDRKN
jgi:hypothetical protein